MLDEYGMRKNTLQFLNRAPKATREIWDKLGITPRGIDREVVDSMHRVQMGVGADYVNILLQGLRTSLSDGWGGSMIGTEVSDILFGTPTITKLEDEPGRAESRPREHLGARPQPDALRSDCEGSC